MRLLAVDTSTWWGGAALLEAREGAPRLVAEIGLWVEDSHASRILPLVEGLLAAAAWPKTALDAYAAVRGPGSFTGIRVALGIVRGLALATSRPCLGVGTLDAMAEAYGPAAGPRIPLIDAGRGEVYGARFDADGSPPVAAEPPWVGAPERAADGAGVVFGNGAEAHASRLRAAGYGGPIGRHPTSVAAAAGRIALAALARGDAATAIEPLYVRPSDAELKSR